MNHEPVISARDVRLSFPDGAGGRVRAVDGIDLDVARGEVLALLGPNGAGKTTLLDLVLGLATPESGRVTVGGRSPRVAVREGRLSALLQTGGLLPDLTAAETVRMIAALHANPADVDEVIDIAGVRPFAARRVGACSGGQQQRLRFALALLPRPEIIVLDEPTAGMDVSARHEFWDRMRAQADLGVTVVFATHYLEEAEQFARRTVLLDKGRVLADGPTDDVRARAGAAYVTVTWSPAAGELERVPHVAEASAEGARITFRTDDADALARHLLTETAAHGLAVRPASLEEAFRLLTAAPTAGHTGHPEEVSA
ncbi:ABC transporter ATP-binding protein [Prauserella rugosa]|uniref:ABC-2 type transport system ATP-binding protein n=1 Tax=Prauserella rugosa TaxID=43354 RepID=A0A660C5G1_9PSEU|nr:ABC transporter ATP-binding protein [Prauserella rugosa]KMS90139.1 ABC transporter ATP-binding protein [Streptomyces regensis]TWH18810.1 ABC-2 type transport system ATP-binding protein [Prauserella rugosa]